ncbi:MAG: NADH-quinone oxidoreductase subunit C [Deltaproteobacteria bacterium]|nr:NADH-quinone oxidoreductase subunit C [Deltaproteobacteria bacterium]
MKNFAVFKNATMGHEESIPILNIGEWRSRIVDACSDHSARIISMFGDRKSASTIRLFCVLASDLKGELLVSATDITDGSYPSLTVNLTEAHLFERELYEDLGVLPQGHPWLKPVRATQKHSFYSIKGDAIHEVAVGPVHAGVIEPGHFRFLCHGEKVFNLEIMLGYQRRGIEELIVSASPLKRMVLAESIAGDSVISHGLCYCHAIEGLAMRKISHRARAIRGIALEIERIANHIGDLGALANDVGFLPVASYFGAIRADFLNLLMELCGNRFGRSLLCPGGLRFDLTREMETTFRVQIEKSMQKVNDVLDIMFSTSSVLARLDNTGVVTQDIAKKTGMVGVAARACNLMRDARANHPSGIYRSKKTVIARASSGDVFARARVRALEIKKSHELIGEFLNKLPTEKVCFSINALNPSAMVISLVEGFRGETVHIARTNAHAGIFQYKIVDPSFHNWTGLEMALRDGQISDFPLCNKSFNLSYAGHDL